MRQALMIVPLLAGALACQTATNLLTPNSDGQSTAATAVAQPEESQPVEPMATATEAATVVDQPDPCSLLSRSQIESVHGQPPGEPIADTFDFVGLGPVPSCRWPAIRLELSVLVPPSGENPQDYYEEYVRRMDPRDFPAGLGDEAWGDPQDGQVLVRQGSTYFMLEEHTFEGDNYQQNLKLASMVLQNLP